MISKMEWTQSNTQQNTESHNGSNNQQWIGYNRTILLERTAAKATVGLKYIYWYQIFALDSAVVVSHIGSNCAVLLIVDWFLFCYERDFMLSLSDNNQTDVVEAFKSTSRCLDDLLSIDNPYFEQMVNCNPVK